MDLFDRYLAAIRRHLDPKKADDIVAELKDILLSKREEKEADLGRPLTAAEQEALVHDFGHPLVVAARYGRQQYLIGPELYPFYGSALRIALGIIATIIIVTGLLGAVFSGGGARETAHGVAETVGRLFGALFWVVGIVTVVFVVMERGGATAKMYESWKPSRLPAGPVKAPSRHQLMVSMVCGAIFLFWWFGLIQFPNILYGRQGQGLHAYFAPIWMQVFWPVAIVSAARMAVDAVTLVRPGWEFARNLATLAVTIAQVALIAVVHSAGHWVEFTGTGFAPSQVAMIQAGADRFFGVFLILIGFTTVIRAIGEVWRLVKTRAPLPQACA